MQIEIKESLISEMIDHVESRYPEEGCGFLIGREIDSRFQIDRVFCGENVDQYREIKFELSGNSYVDATRLAELSGANIVGVYHSHPNCPPIPSETDLKHASQLWNDQPSWLYPILSVVRGQFNQCRWWQLRNRQFDELFVTSPSLQKEKS